MLLFIAGPVAAQSPGDGGVPIPARPSLGAGADTNDSRSYLDYGEEWLVSDPKKARAAGYWAIRLDPTSSPALLLYWRARWLTSPKLLERLERGDMKESTSRAALAIDSLYWQAMVRDPFAVVGAAPGVYYFGSHARMREQLAREPENVALWVQEAAQYYRAAQYDSAVAYVRSALSALELQAGKARRPLYLSREIFHYAIGTAQFAAGDRNAARASFGMALTENLAFHQAHAALASIAWTNWSDLLEAKREFELALELRDDAVVRYDYGTVLLEARDPEAALAQFERAIRAEPYFAPSYFNRALALDRLGRSAEATEAYLAFIERAPARLAEAVQQARGRVRALRAPVDTSAAAPPFSLSPFATTRWKPIFEPASSPRWTMASSPTPRSCFTRS